MSESNKDISGESAREELRRLAPGLDGLKYEDGYNVPHNYFKSLPDRIIEKLSEGEERSSVLQQWWNRLWTPRYALAFATVALLITAGVWLSRPVIQNDPVITISKAEALQYVMANLDEFAAEDLIVADASWEADAWIDISDDNVDEVIDEILFESDEIYMEDLF